MAAKKKTSRKDPSASKKMSAKKKKRAHKQKKPTRRGVKQSRGSTEYPVRGPRGKASGEQSGDLQGLSRVEDADSESVDELLEEGNAFEAGVIEGVEDAEARSERGVHTREVAEDDVPGEYLDRDE